MKVRTCSRRSQARASASSARMRSLFSRANATYEFGLVDGIPPLIEFS